MAHIVAHGKRPLGWEQVYTTTGAAQEIESAIVRVCKIAVLSRVAAPSVSLTWKAFADDTGSPFEHNGSTPVLINVTSAGQDVVVADSARYYLNSCCPAVHGTKLCELGQMSNASGLPDQELCYYTDIAAFDMREKKLTAQQRQHLLGGSASMWTDAYCASNECGARRQAHGWMDGGLPETRCCLSRLLARVDIPSHVRRRGRVLQLSSDGSLGARRAVAQIQRRRADRARRAQLPEWLPMR